MSFKGPFRQIWVPLDWAKRAVPTVVQSLCWEELTGGWHQLKNWPLRYDCGLSLVIVLYISKMSSCSLNKKDKKSIYQPLSSWNQFVSYQGSNVETGENNTCRYCRIKGALCSNLQQFTYTWERIVTWCEKWDLPPSLLVAYTSLSTVC